MSSDDSTLIQNAGYEFISTTAEVIPLILAYGLFFPLSIFALIILVKRGLGPPGRKVLFILTILLFLSYTLYVATWTSLLLLEIKYILTSDLDLSWSSRTARANQVIAPLANIMNWPLTFSLLANDAFVVWRAWIIWSHHHSVMLLPKLLLIVVMLSNVVVNIYSAAILPGNEEVPNSPMNMASFFLSFGVNFIGTCLIYIRAWQHHKAVKTMFNRKTRIERTLALLAESGAIVGLLQLLYPVLLWVSASYPKESPVSALNLVTGVTATIYQGAIALYPVTVIVLIHLQQSVVEDMTFISLTRLGNSTFSPETLNTPSTIKSGNIVIPSDVDLEEQGFRNATTTFGKRISDVESSCVQR